MMDMAIDVSRLVLGAVGIASIIYAAGKMTGKWESFKTLVKERLDMLDGKVEKVNSDVNNGVRAEAKAAAQASRAAEEHTKSTDNSMRELKRDVKRDMGEIHGKINDVRERLSVTETLIKSRPCIAGTAECPAQNQQENKK